MLLSKRMPVIDENWATTTEQNEDEKEPDLDRFSMDSMDHNQDGGGGSSDENGAVRVAVNGAMDV
jgi:hypothetical protein